MPDTILGGRYVQGDQRWANDRETVFRGTDQNTHCAVTIKVPNAARWSDEAWRHSVTQRLELAMPASRRAPGHVLPILDCSLASDPPFVVLDAIEGQTLGERLRAGAHFTGEQVAQLASEALGALGAVHRNGLIHGSLTPDSVLLRPDGTVQLLDLDRPADSSPSLDDARFQAPEQLAGEPANERSDVYALGAVLYAALAGVAPFHDAPNAFSLGTLKGHRPAPLDELRPDAPVQLVACIETALAAAPTERPFSAERFRQDLEREAPVAPQAPPPAPEPPLPAALTGGGETTVMRPLPLPVPVPLPPSATVVQGALEPHRPQAPPPRVVEREGGGGFGAFIGLLVVAGIVAALFFGLKGRTASDLPNLVGKTQQQAVADLNLLALKNKQATGDYTDEVAEGQVYKMDPPAGTKFKKDDTVTLWVSKGAKTIEVPSLANLTEREAKAELKKAGFGYAGATVASEPDKPDKLVVAQTPVAGMKVARGSKVAIFINKITPEADKAKAEPKKAEDKDAAKPTDPASGVVDKIKERTGKAIDDGVTELKDQAREGVKKARDKVKELWNGDKKEKAAPDKTGA